MNVVNYQKQLNLEKKLGYNHNDIMVRQETLITEKIIKLFPNENIVLNEKFKTIRCNPSDPNFDLFKNVGKINLYISKLRKKKQRMR